MANIRGNGEGSIHYSNKRGLRMCYDEMWVEELHRRIQYDKNLLRTAGIYDQKTRKIVKDRRSCEKELSRRLEKMRI